MSALTPEELTSLGYTRSTGHPWAWTDLKTGDRKTAENRIQVLFHKAFYTGWVVSERFGIKLGEVRDDWEPIITKEEYLRGVEILHSHEIGTAHRWGAMLSCDNEKPEKASGSDARERRQETLSP